MCTLGTGTRIPATNDNWDNLETEIFDTHNEFSSSNGREVEEHEGLDCSKEEQASDDLDGHNLSQQSAETEAIAKADAARTGLCKIPDNEPIIFSQINHANFTKEWGKI